MARKRKRTSFADSSSWRCTVLKVLVISLSLASLCGSQDSDFFDNPWIEFGGFLIISFAEGSIELLYECLCDVEITHCSLTYSLAEGLNKRFGFPYYYKVTSFVQNRTQAGESSSERYSSSLLCDTLNHKPEDDLNCRRLPVGDRTCELEAREDHKCIVYSVQQNATSCSYDCASLVWLAEFTFDIKYHNFGSRPLPVNEDICPKIEDLPTPYSVTDTSFEAPVKVQPSQLDENAQFSDDEISNTDIFVGLGSLFALVVVCTVIMVSLRIRQKRNNRTQIRKEENEEPCYNTIDEITAFYVDGISLPVYDDQGYDIIQDFPHISHQGLSRDAHRICRPLPHTPLSEIAASESTYDSITSNSLLSTLQPFPSSLFGKRRQDDKEKTPMPQPLITKEHFRFSRRFSDSQITFEKPSAEVAAIDKPRRHLSFNDISIKPQAFSWMSCKTEKFSKIHKLLADSQTMVQGPPSSVRATGDTNSTFNLRTGKNRQISFKTNKLPKPCRGIYNLQSLVHGPPSSSTPRSIKKPPKNGNTSEAKPKYLIAGCPKTKRERPRIFRAFSDSQIVIQRSPSSPGSSDCTKPPRFSSTDHINKQHFPLEPAKTKELPRPCKMTYDVQSSILGPPSGLTSTANSKQRRSLKFGNINQNTKASESRKAKELPRPYKTLADPYFIIQGPPSSPQCAANSKSLHNLSKRKTKFTNLFTESSGTNELPKPHKFLADPRNIPASCLTVNLDSNFKPCDYLTVLDTQLLDVSESSGYLKVLDIDSVSD